MAKHYPDSRPYPYDTDKPQWAALWIALAGIILAILLGFMM